MVKAVAAVARERGAPLSLEEIELDDPRDDEVLVRVAACGVCHTDIKARDGYGSVAFPIVLGHEGAGTIVEVGSAVRDLAPGDRVLLVSDYCGRCALCRAGRTAYCEEGPRRTFGAVRPDGSTRARIGGEAVRASFFGQSAFATYALASERNALKVSDELPLQLFAATTCGMVTGAGAVLQVLPVGPGRSLAVLGTGTVGLAAVMAARAAGASLIVAVDQRPFRLELARELGASHAVDTLTTPDLANTLRDITDGGCDAILDTTGSGELQLAAVHALAALGQLGIAGGGGEPGVPLGSLMVGGKSVRGIIQGDSSGTLGLQRLLKLHQAGRFPFERLVHPYPFERVNEAIEDSLSGAAVKPVLLFPGG
ncbi:MAG: alcohol dehydrogenase catalytic domain-containing protein [Candidatus Dormibacteria bacterium]